MKLENKDYMNLDDEYSVSIVMPTYNRKETVTKNIKKLLYGHEYNPTKYEIIVTDDGGTDGTYNHLKKKFKKEIEKGRLKVLTQKNHGLSRARKKIDRIIIILIIRIRGIEKLISRIKKMKCYYRNFMIYCLDPQYMKF